jgi:hypothetical protein
MKVKGHHTTETDLGTGVLSSKTYQHPCLVKRRFVLVQQRGTGEALEREVLSTPWRPRCEFQFKTAELI